MDILESYAPVPVPLFREDFVYRLAHPHSVVFDADNDVRAVNSYGNLDDSAFFLFISPCLTAFSTKGCNVKGGSMQSEDSSIS